MKTQTLKTLAWLLAAGALAPAVTAGAAPAQAEVTYHEPEKFTDLRNDGLESERLRALILTQLREHIEQRASAQLPEGYTLAVTIHNIDLAGDFEPWRNSLHNVRIVRDRYPPRIDLEYTLRDATGRVVAAARHALSDPAFLQTANPLRQDMLRHEKDLLDAWMRHDFGALGAT